MWWLRNVLFLSGLRNIQIEINEKKIHMKKLLILFNLNWNKFNLNK